MAHLRRFEGFSRARIYVASVCKLLCRHDVYNLFRCFPYIRDAGYGEEFKDVGDGRTSLSRGVFESLVSIRPSHLVYRSGDIGYLEPYVPCRASLDMTNSTLAIRTPMGSLIDDARAWRYFITGCTEAWLCMPLRTPNLLMTLGFCQWYKTSNSAPTRFNPNSFGLKWISKRMKQKLTAKEDGKRVRVPGIPELIVAADSEVSNTESPRSRMLLC